MNQDYTMKQKEFIQEAEIRITEELSRDSYRRQEEGIPHNSIEFSNRFLEAFKSNELETVLLSMIEFFSPDEIVADGWQPGVLADNNERNIHNLLLCLFWRIFYFLQDTYPADYEKLATVADACVRVIEREKSPEKAFYALVASVRMLYKYFLDKKRKADYHPLIKGTKNYIFSHLHQEIQVKEIAASLNTSPNYLSQTFSRYEGMSITNFIMNERMTQAKDLLVYSNMSIDEIWTSLAFCSASYFGKCFKKYTGMTPRMYREKFFDKKQK